MATRGRSRSSGERQSQFDIEMNDEAERVSLLDAQRQERVDELMAKAKEMRWMADAGGRMSNWSWEDSDEVRDRARVLEQEAAQIQSEMGTAPYIPMPGGRMSSRRRQAAAPRSKMAAQRASTRRAASRAPPPSRGMQCQIPRDPRTGRFVSRYY